MKTKQLWFIFACLLYSFNTNAQSQIIGNDFVQEDCCEWYSIRITDTLNIPAVWTLCDINGDVLDTLVTTNPHQFELCLERYPKFSPPLLLKVSIPDLQFFAEKLIEVIPLEPLDIFADYPCIIRDSFGCTEICIGSIATYGVETGNPTGLFWTVTGGTIVEDDGWSITVLWDQEGKHIVRVEEPNSSCPKTAELCVDVLPVPTADFTTSPAFDASREITVCKGQNIYFEDASLGNRRVQWDFNNGFTSRKRSVEYSYDVPGEYKVNLTADNGCDCLDSTSIKVTVLDAISPQLTCVGTTCPAESNTYYVENDCAETVWTVSSNGSILDGGGLQDDFITVVWNNGPYGVITVLGQNCPAGYCPEPSVFRIPVISGDGPISGDQTVCVGQITTYSAPFFQGTEYFWTASSGATILDFGNDNTFTVKWDRVAAPDASQWIEVSYDNCYLECGGQDRIGVTVLGRYTLEGEKLLCQDDPISVQSKSVQNGSAVTCSWIILDEFNVTRHTESATANFSPMINLPPGKYTVVSEANVADYCDHILEFKFEILENPAEPSAILGETAVCKNAVHQFDIDQLDANYIVNWEIIDGGLTVSLNNQTTAYYTFTTDGPYEVRAQYQEAATPFCASDFVTMNLIKHQYTVDGGQDHCQEEIAQYTCTSLKPSGFSWSINPPDAGVIIEGQGEDKVEIFWALPGQHQVVLEHCGGNESLTVDVTAKPDPIVNHPAFLCEGSQDMVSLSQAFSSVTWKDESGAVVGSGPSIMTGAGFYSVEVVDAQGCTGEEQFRIDERPAPDAVISFGDLRAFCDTEPFTPRILYANTDGDYHYQWYHEGLPVGADSPTLKATAFGTYTCLVTNDLGCTKMSNNLTLFLDCDDNAGGVCNGNCKKKTCPTGIDVDFEILDAGVYCNEKILRNTTPGTVISHEWFIEDLRNGGWISDFTLEPRHKFQSAGFHMVIFDALIRPASNPGITCQDHLVKVVKIPLAAWFTADNQCAGTPVEFVDLTTYIPGEIINSYSWDFGDPMSGGANYSNADNPQHTYMSPGKYTTKLTVESGSGCISEYEYEVEIYDLPAVNFTAPNQLCVGAALEVMAPSSLHDVQWNFGDAGSNANEATSDLAYHEYSTTGNYNITLTGKNIYGCEETLSRMISIIDVTNKEQIQVNGTNPFCEGGSVTLEGPSTAVAWYWNHGPTSKDVVITQPGKYSVEIETADGCRYTTDEVEVTVNRRPTVTALASQKNQALETIASSITRLEICAGDLASLDAIGKAGLVYTWSNGRVGTRINHPSWNPVGSYNYSVDARDPLTGCTNTSNVIEIVVHPIPSMPAISSNPQGILCENNEITFAVISPNNQLTYIWSNGQEGTEIKVTGAGDYSVTAYNQFGCSMESSSFRVHPAPNADVVMSGCLTRCNPDTICLPNMLGVTQYQWYKDGAIIPSPEGTIRDYVATESGTYRLMVTNAAGCSDISDELTLDITPGYGDLTVTVYLDVNENGVIDAGDIVLEDIKVNVTDPNGTILSDLSDQLGEITWYDKESGLYEANVDNDSLQLVPGLHEVDIFGCGDPFNINILLTKKCPETLIQLDTTICALDTLYHLDTFLVDAGMHTIEKMNIDGCLETTEILITHEVPQHDLKVTVYLDVNNNGVIDATDRAFPGIDVILLDGLTELERQRTTGLGEVKFGRSDLNTFTARVDTSQLGVDYIGIIVEDDVTFTGCDGQYELALLIKKIDTNVFVPNVFTPNGDENNDVFRVFTANEDDLITYFAIYDRWGELLFESNEIISPKDIGWDGTLNGKKLNPGVFVYVVGVKTFTGDEALLKGDVTLLN